jgi:hypothetical protein
MDENAWRRRVRLVPPSVGLAISDLAYPLAESRSRLDHARVPIVMHMYQGL